MYRNTFSARSQPLLGQRTHAWIRPQSTNNVQRAESQNSGTYSFVGLNIGTYQLSVSKTGFNNTVFNSVVVHASRVTDLAVVLQVGSVNQKVIVTGSQTPLLETTSNVIGSTIDLKQIEDLPLQDRDPTMFAANLPGAVVMGTDDIVFNNEPQQSQVNVVDGVIGNSSRFKAGGNIEPAASPRIQNLQEFTVQTSQLNAGQGAGQAAMQAVFSTRRGGNAYHGRLFEDMQNASFNANSWYNDYFGIPKAVYHKNDFGGSIGGPILKNKLFFFGSYEQDHIPGTQIGANSFMTPALQAGNYTYLGTDGTSHTVNLLSIAGAAGLQSTMDTAIAAEVANINSSLKLGTISNVGGEDQYESQNVQQINFTEPNSQNTYFPTFRIDYNASKNVRTHFAFNYNKFSAPTALIPTFPGPDFAYQNDGYGSTAYTAAIGADWTISPRLINQFQGGYLYNYAVDSPKAEAGNYNQKYPIVWWVGPWGLNLGASGAGASGDFFYSGISNFYPLISFSDNMVWQHGSHTFTFGGSFYREQDHYWNPPQGYDNVVMGLGAGDPALNVFQQTNPALATANPGQIGEMQSYYALLTGDITTIAGSHPINPKTHQYEKYGALNLDELQKAWGLFFQDSWRVRPDLTVNYGLRWDFTGDDHDLNSIYYSPTVAGLWGPSGINNAFHPGSFNGPADPAYVSRGHAYSPWNVSPQPNIGIAWNPSVSEGFLGKLMGGNNTVVRVGYSLRRYTPQYQDYWTYASNYGSFFYQNYQINASNAPGPALYQAGTLHLSDYVAGNLPSYPSQWYVSPESYSSQISESSQGIFAPLEGMNPNIAQRYIESWNIGIQRKLGRANAIEVRYVGNRGVHA
ncbi:MAG: carboxypeptidase regulatory-like domain-containing protein [Acidobacteriaceae bacterium]